MTSHDIQTTDTRPMTAGRAHSDIDPSLLSTGAGPKQHRLSWNNGPRNRRSRTLGTTAAAKKYLQQIVSAPSFKSDPEQAPPEASTVSPSTATAPTVPAPVASAPRARPTSMQIGPRPTRTASPVMAPPNAPNQNRNPMVFGGGNSGIPSHNGSVLGSIVPSANASTSSLGGSFTSSSPSLTGTGINNVRHGRSGSVGSLPLTSEKPIASTSGGAMSVTLQLAEPFLFLQGFENNGQSGATPALLRGSLILRLAKPAKIKAVHLSFKGRARTEWPEGIPPKKADFFEDKEVFSHVWPFFNVQFGNAELGHGADSARIFGKEPEAGVGRPGPALSGAIGSLARNSSPIGLSVGSSTSAADKRLSLQTGQSKGFGKGEAPAATMAQKGYRLFQAGDYIYNFEHTIDSIYPETINCDLGSVKYELEATIERAGAFRPNLVGRKEVLMIRCPAEGSLEQVEPIAISRNWEDQLHYDIVISGKSFPIGSSIPIAFKLTPLAKVRCHRIKIFLTENVEYFCKNKKVHRIEPTRKIQLYEKRADGPVNAQYPGSSARVISGGPSRNVFQDFHAGEPVSGQDSLLGDLTGDAVGPTEMEFNVQLPGCGAKDKDKIHFDTTSKDIVVHHWIKIVMRLSKTDPADSTKRRHFEISIDSPFHILSCKCSQANTALPAYTDSRGPAPPSFASCGCPVLQRRNSPLSDTTTMEAIPDMPMPPGDPYVENRSAPPAFARPMHLLRAPSFNPPPFEADVAPPPIMTPPPLYDSMYSSADSLADYFMRLSDFEHEEEDEDDGHMRIPRTPGGRLVRSMDERRTWEPIGRAS